MRRLGGRELLGKQRPNRDFLAAAQHHQADRVFGGGVGQGPEMVLVPDRLAVEVRTMSWRWSPTKAAAESGQTCLDQRSPRPGARFVV